MCRDTATFDVVIHPYIEAAFTVEDVVGCHPFVVDINNESNSSESFDFVFIDADKERYIQYFDVILPMVKPGGLIGADNILFPERFQKFSNLYVKHVRNNPKVR